MLTFKKEPERYTKSEATELIKRIARNGSTRVTKHAKDRMKDRNVTMQDILHAIKNGRVSDEPELDIKTNHWKYNINGNGIDINNLTITTNIHAEDGFIVLITVF